MNSKITMVSIDSIDETNAGLPQHKMDERLMTLMDQVLAGSLRMYYGEVPIGQLVPYDLDYRPDLHPITKEVIESFIEEWKRGHLQKMIVYQRGTWFVVSDDYITLFAVLRGRPDYVPCWILGKPEHAQVKNVQGPIAQADVNKVLGLAE